MIIHKKIPYKEWVFKSNQELFFCFYLEELQEEGYIKEFGYERVTFDLSESIYLPYIQQLKTREKLSSEFIIRENTYSPDFDIHWTDKGRQFLWLDRTLPITCKISEIPFRLTRNDRLVTFPEIKPPNESKLASSVEFPVHQKWVFQKYGCYIQKIVPYNPLTGGKSLFRSTFYPKKVLELERYKVNCAGGKKGDSKIKHKYLTCDEFLKLNINDTKTRHTYTTRGR